METASSLQHITHARPERTIATVTGHIERWRDNVLDLDILVDDRRADVVSAVEALRAAVRVRDRAVCHLEHLLGAALQAASSQPAASVS
jgi:hypothetical protein